MYRFGGNAWYTQFLVLVMEPNLDFASVDAWGDVVAAVCVDVWDVPCEKAGGVHICTGYAVQSSAKVPAISACVIVYVLLRLRVIWSRVGGQCGVWCDNLEVGTGKHWR